MGKIIYFEIHSARSYSFIIAEARLMTELAESKSEVWRLRERMLIGTPTVHKDLSISVIPKCSGLRQPSPYKNLFLVLNGQLQYEGGKILTAHPAKSV
jgi:hypothetical protein